jgi:hypothetical protein
MNTLAVRSKSPGWMKSRNECLASYSDWVSYYHIFWSQCLSVVDFNRELDSNVEELIKAWRKWTWNPANNTWNQTWDYGNCMCYGLHYLTSLFISRVLIVSYGPPLVSSLQPIFVISLWKLKHSSMLARWMWNGKCDSITLMHPCVSWNKFRIKVTALAYTHACMHACMYVCMFIVCMLGLVWKV